MKTNWKWLFAYPVQQLFLVAATFALAVSPSAADDWPQWRGPNRTGHSTETGLLKEWPEDGPPVAWQIKTVGEGYSSVAVQGDRVVTMGDLDGVEHIICLSASDGSTLWAVQPEPVAEALRERVEEQFARMDKNEDGKLDQVEAMSGLGWNFGRLEKQVDGDRDTIAKERAADLLKRVDENSDGSISYAEAPGALQREFTQLDREDKSADGIELAASRAKELLAADKDLDGKVSREEAKGTLLDRLFGRIDEKREGENKGDGQLTEQEIRTYLFAKQPGRDGRIDSEELAEYFARNFPQRTGTLTKADLWGQFGGFRNGTGNGPRGTPTIDGQRVYAEGGSGDLSCLDLATGKTIWHLSLTKDLGGGRPGWGYCESPLVTDRWVIVTPGGKEGTVAALDKETGEVVWRSKEVQQSAHYSSPQLVEIAGVKQIVQFARNSVFGVTLDGSYLLWSYSGANNGTANIATPIVDGDRVLASSAYGTGGGLVKVTPDSSTKQNAEEVYFTKRMSNHHGGLVKVGDYVYGFSGGLVCMEFATGEVAWKARSVGKGSLIYADGMLYCLGERHEVALVDANPEEYVEHGRFKIENLGRPSWAHPAIANGKFYIRNQERLTAYDIKAK